MTRRALRLPLVALVLAVLMPLAYALLGGTDYHPAAAGDPCEPRPVPREITRDEQIQQLGLAAVDRAACDLEVDRGRLAIGLLDDAALDDFVRDEGLTEGEVEAAVRRGVGATLDEVERGGAVDGTLLRVLRAAVDVLPLRRLVGAVNGTSDPCAEPSWRPVEGDDQLYAQVALIALDQAACTLDVSPEAFALALADERSLAEFREREGLSEQQVEDAVRDGLRRGLGEAEEADAVGGFELLLLREGVDRLPLSSLLETLRTGELQLD